MNLELEGAVLVGIELPEVFLGVLLGLTSPLSAGKTQNVRRRCLFVDLWGPRIVMVIILQDVRVITWARERCREGLAHLLRHLLQRYLAILIVIVFLHVVGCLLLRLDDAVVEWEERVIIVSRLRRRQGGHNTQG